MVPSQEEEQREEEQPEEFEGHGRLNEAWRPRKGHDKGGRFGDRGGKNKEWWAARSRAARRGQPALQKWLKENPKPKK